MKKDKIEKKFNKLLEVFDEAHVSLLKKNEEALRMRRDTIAQQESFAALLREMHVKYPGVKKIVGMIGRIDLAIEETKKKLKEEEAKYNERLADHELRMLAK